MLYSHKAFIKGKTVESYIFHAWLAMQLVSSKPNEKVLSWFFTSIDLICGQPRRREETTFLKVPIDGICVVKSGKSSKKDGKSLTDFKVPKKEGVVVEDMREDVTEGQLGVEEVPRLWILIIFLLYKLCFDLFK